MTHPPEQVVHIGEVAERTGLSHRTIRYYEEMGLITPSGRTEGGFRLYADDDIDRLLLIKPMKPLGFTIEQIRDLLTALDILDGTDSTAEQRAGARAVVSQTHTSTRTRITELKEATARAEAFTRRLAQEMRPD